MSTDKATCPAPRREDAGFPFRSRRSLALFALIVVLLYAAGVSGHWRFQRDSALYMGLGRSLAETGSYSFNGEPHRLALPGFPALLSLVYRTVGESFLAMNVMVTLFGLGCVALGLLLFRNQALTRSQALACVLLLGFSRTLYYYSTHIMTDVPFTFFVLLGLYCGTRAVREGHRTGWWSAAALATAAACAVRPIGLALLAALAAAPWLQPHGLRQWRSSLARTILVVTPTAILGALWLRRGAGLGVPAGTSYFHWFLGVRGFAGVARHIVGQVPVLTASLSDVILGSNLGTSLGLALGLLIGVGFLNAVRRGERLLCAFGVVYLGAVCLAWPGRRLLLPVLPVLLVWLVMGVSAAAEFMEKRLGFSSRPQLVRMGQVLLALSVLVNLTHLSKNIHEAHAADFYAVTEGGRLPDYFALVQWLRDNGRRDDCVLAGEGNLIHYFSRVRTTRPPLRAAQVDAHELAERMKRVGVTFLVIDHGKRKPTERVEPLLSAYPDAFEKLATFGKLDLFRVHADRLDGDDGPNGQE